jgi:hypothetical protein
MPPIKMNSLAPENFSGRQHFRMPLSREILGFFKRRAGKKEGFSLINQKHSRRRKTSGSHFRGYRAADESGKT